MAWARISIWELRLMLEQAIMDMLSLSFRPKVVRETITAKKTATIIVTQEVQVEMPTELQKIIKMIPFWALAAIGVLMIIVMAMGVYMMGAKARAKRAAGGRRRRR